MSRLKARLTRLALLLLAVLALTIVFAAVVWGPVFYRVEYGYHSHDSVPPELPPTLGKTAILVFSKTNGFRHDSIGAANDALAKIAARHGWSVFETENGAVFNPSQLARFKAVVWNNVSGDVLGTDQQNALKAYLENGGGFVGIHAAGGDFRYVWRWYVDDLIGAQFIGHTLGPQFPQATVHIEDHDHPATRGLPSEWTRSDEWYSFASDPRRRGYHVLATLDERTYEPVMRFNMPFLKPINLRMGDHPIVWLHCIGNGRVFYSAMGHRAEAYREPEYVRMLDGAIVWAAGLDGKSCINGKY
jgi:type 1 glutamine amidotransferase